MDLEANKLIFPEKKSPEKVDSRWWQMEDVNKYLRKNGRKVGQKVEERAQKAVDTRLTDWRRKQIFRDIRRMTRLVGPQMELDSGLIATKTRGASSKKIIKRGSWRKISDTTSVWFHFFSEFESDNTERCFRYMRSSNNALGVSQSISY